MAHIKKIKTWHGLRYAVVSPFTVNYYDEKGNPAQREEEHAVEYKVGKDTRVAVFPLTASGLGEAKKVQKSFNK